MRLNKITLALLGLSFAQFAVADNADNSATQPETTAQSEVSSEASTSGEAQTQTLQNVTVRAKAARAISEATNSYQRDRVNLGLLGRQNAFTAPITVVNYDEKAFADKNPRNMVDAIAQTDASVMSFGGETNSIQGLYVRGLQLDSRQFSVNGLAGMYSAYSSPTSNVGAAQLIKGASSATVGMDPEGAVGSSVNIETKKADNNGNRNIGFSWFGKSRWQPSFDLGQRFGDSKQWGVRINGKYRDGDTPRKHYSETTKEAAINVDYRGEKFQAALDGAYSQRATRGGRARVQDIQLYNFRLPDAPDGKINLVPSWQAQTARDKSIMFTFNWQPSDWVAISGGIGHLDSLYSGNFGQLQILDTAGNYRNAFCNNRGVCTQQGSQPRDQHVRTTSVNLKALGYFQTGPVSHNWNTAFDFVKRNRNFVSAPRVAALRNLNIYTPVFPAAPIMRTPSTQVTDEELSAPSLALSDTLGFMDDTIRVTLGGRYQKVKQKDLLSNINASAHRFSPMLMAAWVPNNDFVLYGNYLEDLEPGAVDDEGNMSKPRVSRQLEFGVRKNWGNIVTSANVYQLTRESFWRSAGRYNGVRHSAGDVQGKERVRGLELNAYANLMDKTLRPYLGMSFIKHDLIDSPTYTGQLVSAPQVASPHFIAKAGIEWDTPFVKGLTLNAGLQHYGKSYQDTAKKYTFPSYALVDAGVKYQHKVRDDQTLTVRAGVENLFNKNYWQVQRGTHDRSFAVVGMPRTFWLKADYSF